MPQKPPRPQFIAGAVCPSCHVMDRIVVVGNADQGHRSCVACGYSDATQPGASVLPETRFSRPSAMAGDRAGRSNDDGEGSEQISPVKIIESPPPKT